MWNRLRPFFFRDRKEAELDDELRHHIELETEKNIREGLTPMDARRKALLDFGGMEQTKEKTRESWGVEFLDHLGQDVFFTFRALGRRPLFTSLALLSLTLGIAANTTVFPALNTFLLKPLDLRDSGSLFHLSGMDLNDGMLGAELSMAEFQGIRTGLRSVAGAGAYVRGEGMVFRGASEPLFLRGSRISPGLLSLVGIAPAMGRTFLPDDEAPGAPGVTLISHGLWTRAFGQDPDVLGRTVTVDGFQRTIVGVLRPGWEFPEPLDLWVPVLPATEANRHDRDWEVVVRLSPGASPQEAQSELTGVLAALEAEEPNPRYPIAPRLKRLREEFIATEAVGSVLVLYLLVSMILLVACFNVGTLLLARGADRGEEMAVRAGLGAGRGRILQQLLVESLILAILGAVPGLLLGRMGLKWMMGRIPLEFPAFIDFSLDPAALLLLAGLVLLSGLVAGLWPALQASRPDLAHLLRGVGPRAGSALASGRGRAFLVGGQIALTLAVMAGAGVLLKGLVKLQRVDPGFNLQELAGVMVDLEEIGPTGPSERLRTLEALQGRLATLPGVTATTVGAGFPIRGQHSTLYFSAHGMPGEGESPDLSLANSVRDDFFQVLGIPLAEGRSFGPADGGPGAPLVAVVDRAFADRHFPGETPLGRPLTVGRRTEGRTGWKWEVVEIVGVVETAHWIPVGRDPGTIFRPIAQDPVGEVTLMATTGGHPADLLPGLSQVVREVTPELSIHWTATAEGLVRQGRWTTELFGALFTVMAVLGTLMATVGIFGLMADSMARRTREFGIRAAVGASPRELRGMALAQAGRVVMVGLVVGLILGALFSQALRGLVTGVTPFDPVIFLLSSTLTGATAILAAYLPALRAGRVDPVQALRSE